MFLSYIYILFYLAFIGIIDIDDAIQELVETVRIKFHCRFFGKDEDDIQLEDIICAASLAHHRVLDYDTVEYLSLNDVNLSKVPTEHLASLVSHVTKDFNINNISGCDLVTILESVQCETLTISNQSLGREETRALLQAMESRVVEVEIECFVMLKSGPEDITALTKYSEEELEDGGKMLWRYSRLTYEGEKMKKIVKSGEELWYWSEDQGEYKGDTILDKKIVKSEE